MTTNKISYHCSAPWISLSINVDRSFSLCSNTMNSVKIGNWNEQSILETINSTALKNYRQAFLNNESIEICNLCSSQEVSGINSKRLDYNSNYPLISFTDEDRKLSDIKHLEISLSNLCNQSCRTCSSFLSSMWNKDSDKLRREIHTYSEVSEKQFNELLEVSKTLNSLVISGGEPLIQEQIFTLLENLIGTNNECNVTISTSLSIPTSSIVRLISISKSLPNLSLNISLDGVGKKGEYIRAGVIFKDYEDNIELVSSSSIPCAYQVTISILNIFDIREILTYIEKSPLSIIHGIEFYLVTNPTYYNIQILPKKLKAILQAELYSLVLDFKSSEKIRPLLRKVLSINTHLQMDNVSANLKDFFRETKKVDRLRNEDFKKIFFNTYQLLKSY
ncbi:twitch domain-containing radical SAM protein [Halobacteriovorax sp. HLS]|uniref:twitch domain-containing radical SAM protein n=1 Tax=Halobacteriovorax sp. HLS TaxID=2234000 RepID=UPI000FDA74D7|nr:twitch domain-containing radical SAM protein [Halobacteriovorax sp. HLS]